MELPQRKPLRLESWDYGEDGYYFITICTKDKRNLFGRIVGNGLDRSAVGTIAETHLIDLPNHFPLVRLDKYVVMPNHIHAILVIDHRQAERSRPFPTLSTMVGLYKSGVSRAAGFPVWQKSFHDHIIRGKEDYRMIWDYIDQNPLKWMLDRYYTE